MSVTLEDVTLDSSDFYFLAELFDSVVETDLADSYDINMETY